MQFIMGMYWAARSPLTLRMRMREVRTGLEGVSGFAVIWLVLGVGERESVDLLMWVRANVSAPAIAVVGLLGRESGEVVERRWVRDVRRVSWISRKGRYLFASSWAEALFCAEGSEDGCGEG